MPRVWQEMDDRALSRQNKRDMTLLELLFSDPWRFLATILAFLLTLGIHESAHAWVAYLLGDTTAQREGRLTLNPLSHIDVTGFIMLVTIGFGWGKPVPFNPYNLRWPRVGPVLVAAAGPLSNFLITVISALLLRVLLPTLGVTNLLSIFLLTLSVLSCMLGLFNLIPLPPLDGSKALLALLSGYKYAGARRFLETRGPMILLGLVILGLVTGINVFGGLQTASVKTVFFLLGTPNV